MHEYLKLTNKASQGLYITSILSKNKWNFNQISYFMFKGSITLRSLIHEDIFQNSNFQLFCQTKLKW